MKRFSDRREFFGVLERQALLVAESASRLREAVAGGGPALLSTAAQIHRMEREGDCLVRELLSRLSRSVLVPADPEAIHHLSAVLDDILDGIEDIAYWLSTYKLDPIPDEVGTLCEVTKCATKSVHAALAAFSRGEDLLVFCADVQRLETQADEVFLPAMERLMAGGEDALRVVKLKQIYEALEETMDRAEDAADILRDVTIPG